MAGPWEQYGSTSKASTDSAPSTGPWAAYKEPTSSSGEPDTGSDIHAFGRAAGEAVVPGLTGLAGAVGGAVAIAPVAATAAALSGPAAPIVGASLELLGAGVGAFAGGEGVGWVQDKLHQLIAPEDYRQRQLERQQHPWSTFFGGVAGGALGLSPRTVVDPTARFINTAMKARAASGIAQAGMSAGTQLAVEGKIDPLQTLAAGATGVALPGVNVLGKPFVRLGETVAGKKAPDVTSTKPSEDIPKPPPKDASPEEKAAFVEKLKKIKAERDATSPIQQAAIRNKETGEVELMGPKHDEARKAETLDTHDQGFVDERGNFLDRKEAWDRAIKTGQLPKDAKPEFIKEGLHSGDFRKYGVKGWEVTPEQPAGVPKPPVEEAPIPKSREDFKKAIQDKEEQIVKLEELADNTPNPDEASRLQEQANKLRQEYDQLHKDMPQVQFENPEKPNWEELHDHLWGAKTVGEAFDRIAQADIGSKGQKLLLAALNRSEFIRKASLNLHNDFISYVDKNGVEQKDAAGLYTGSSHNLDLGKKGNLQVFLHESVHVGTHALIESGKSKAAIELKRLLDFHKDSLGVGADEAIAKFQAANPKATVKDITNYRKYVEYGITNEHEFISEAFTNKDFQEILSKLPADPNRPVSKLHNLWESFKQAIADGLGLKDRTALDDVLDTGTKLIEASRKRDVTSTKGAAVPSTAKEDAKQKLAFEREYNAAKSRLMAERQAGDKDRYERDIQKTQVPTHEEILAAMDKRDALPSKALEEDTTPEVAKAAEKVDVRSIPNEEEFYKHATDVYERYGEAEALKFFEDYKKNQAERTIPVPKDEKGLDDALHKIDTFQTADKSEHVTGYKENTEAGVTEQEREQAFMAREMGHGDKVGGVLGDTLRKLDSENLALVRKAKGMGLDVGDEFVTGQSRIRIYGGVKSSWKDMIKELFANRMPFSEKVADQANAAMERKVYQLEDGRVIEIHRQPEDKPLTYTDESGKKVTRNIKKGTEFFEWRDGQKSLIGHSENLEFKRGDKVAIRGDDGVTRDLTMVDGKVYDIEKHSPYRYLHDAEASARLANMGLRKMVRDAELMNNLMKSDLFERVGHAPTKDLKTLPQGWRVPDNIDKIPQLRGWHFDPKTAAIIEDFAKVWDNTMWMKLSNQIVKNMMLNPLPHMFNEVMHLYNARGFTGWVDPRQLGTFASTARQAWRDVGQQTQFYRDIMREGGSVLGADPRNNLFDTIVMDAGKRMVADKEMSRGMGLLAKKLGTTVGDLYNGLSRKSQQAMWFTRDVMYVQYVREIMARQEKATGTKMELKDAIDIAEKHMPNYRMPSEVLGSRGLAKVLKNPNVSMFSRYHYGMVKSLVNTLKDVNPHNLKTPEGRKHFREGVDSMLAIGVALGVLYPLMDTLAQTMFGEGAEQRRAGPYHLIHAGEQVAKGEKDVSALIWPIFTFNPMLLSLGQLAFNKNIFTGKKIYHSEDPVKDIVSDVGAYGMKQVPQAPAIMGAVQEEGGEGQFIAKQLDIKVKTPQQRAAERAARKREAAATKGRVTKREKGTYRP